MNRAGRHRLVPAGAQLVRFVLVYDVRMSRRSPSVLQRMRDQLFFSVVSILVLFLILRAVGIRSSVGSIVLSIALTVMLNAGLSYWSDSRAKREARRGPQRRPAPGGGDIRWREDDRDVRYRDDDGRR